MLLSLWNPKCRIFSKAFRSPIIDMWETRWQGLLELHSTGTWPYRQVLGDNVYMCSAKDQLTEDIAIASIRSASLASPSNHRCRKRGKEPVPKSTSDWLRVIHRGEPWTSDGNFFFAYAESLTCYRVAARLSVDTATLKSNCSRTFFSLPSFLFLLLFCPKSLGEMRLSEVRVCRYYLLSKSCTVRRLRKNIEGPLRDF